MLIDENAMNNKIVVVLANTKEEAIEYGKKVNKRPDVDIMPMHQRSEIYLLYGHRKMPMVIAPGTLVQDWHSELDHHIEWERITPIGKYRTKQIG